MKLLDIFKRKPKRPVGHIEVIRWMAQKYDWEEILHQESERRLRFTKGIDNAIVDVWYSKMTVGTILNHPIQGRTSLFRKRVSEHLLEEIFADPRIHTSSGYKRKRRIYKKYGNTTTRT